MRRTLDKYDFTHIETTDGRFYILHEDAITTIAREFMERKSNSAISDGYVAECEWNPITEKNGAIVGYNTCAKNIEHAEGEFCPICGHKIVVGKVMKIATHIIGGEDLRMWLNPFAKMASLYLVYLEKNPTPFAKNEVPMAYSCLNDFYKWVEKESEE